MKRAGRLHAPEIEALAAAPAAAATAAEAAGTAPEAAATAILLRAPMPGVFMPWIAQGDLVTAGGAIGEIVVLGKATAVIAPRFAGTTPVTGIAIRVTATGVRAVGYGDTLVALDPSLQLGAAAQTGEPATAGPSVTGLVFRAPTSGRFYGRSAPDKPPFVADGTELAPGATICLLEVMKTFHRVTYGGPGLPDTARVTRVLVAEGADVNAGDPLLALV